MSAFDWSNPRGSGTYRDRNGVAWRVYADDPMAALRGDYSADAPSSSPYGLVTLFGPVGMLRDRIDAYAAGYSAVPPGGVPSAPWIWIALAAWLLLDDKRRNR